MLEKAVHGRVLNIFKPISYMISHQYWQMFILSYLLSQHSQRICCNVKILGNISFQTDEMRYCSLCHEGEEMMGEREVWSLVINESVRLKAETLLNSFTIVIL